MTDVMTDSPPHTRAFVINGEILAWDPLRRELQIGTHLVCVAPSVPVAKLTCSRLGLDLQIGLERAGREADMRRDGHGLRARGPPQRPVDCHGAHAGLTGVPDPAGRNHSRQPLNERGSRPGSPPQPEETLDPLNQAGQPHRGPERQCAG